MFPSRFREKVLNLYLEHDICINDVRLHRITDISSTSKSIASNNTNSIK